MFTVHHGITKSQIGRPLANQFLAELKAKTLSNSDTMYGLVSIEVWQDGDAISFATRGTLYPAEG